MTDDFYQGSPKERQLVAEPYYQDSPFRNRWEEFIALMTSGPTSVLLLHSDDGKAIQNWRDQVGHWNIEKTVQPQTIRGQYGRDNFNNLIHGSDSQEAVKREFSIIAAQLRRMATK